MICSRKHRRRKNYLIKVMINDWTTTSLLITTNSADNNSVSEIINPTGDYFAYQNINCSEEEFMNSTFSPGFTDSGTEEKIININDNSTKNETAIYGEKNYLALLLLVIPCFTLFGNGLVVLSICREKALHTTTNYLILSLAVADFLVALCVMPFAVYVEVEQSEWRLPKLFCNLYIAGDVCASTASILNLVAVSWDRYMAVSSPIEYAQNNKKRVRVKATIFAVWFVSAITASPIMMGLNKLDNTVYCEFTDPLYIFVSSVVSFYVPCMIIIVLYSVVLKKLRRRKKRVAMRKNGQQHFQPAISQATVNGGNFEEFTMGDETTKAGTNGWTLTDPPIDVTSVIGHVEQSSSGQNRPSMANIAHQLFYQHSLIMIPALYSTKNLDHCNKQNEDLLEEEDEEETDNSLQNRILTELNKRKHSSMVNGEIHYYNSDHVNGDIITSNIAVGGGSNFSVWLQKKKRYKRKCSARKKAKRNESKNSRKERKATQTLAIVLGVFLICWLPFFICHLTNSICKFRFEQDCIPLMAMFITTWLGYVNSFLNPIIYTIFNPQYRKAFKRLFRKKRRRYV